MANYNRLKLADAESVGAPPQKPPAGSPTEAPVADRIRAGAGGVFQAWAPAENFNAGSGNPTVPLASAESPRKTEARHSLVFSDFAEIGLQVPSSQPYTGLATGFTADSVQKALQKRAELLKDNPNMVMLAEVRYRDAPGNYLPEDSPFWKRDRNGERAIGYVADGQPRYLLDFSNPKFQDMVAQQCKAAVKSGAVDGCMLDWWGEGETTDRVNLAHKVRDAIGEKAVLIVNSNGMKPERSAPYINGMYMEGLGASFFKDADKAGQTLLWAQNHLDPNLPPITALEGWGDRKDLRNMREVTTLSLTHSNGYVLFGDKDGIAGRHDHGHDLYSFDDAVKGLGRPTGPLAQRGPDGEIKREFANGTVVYNSPDNKPVNLCFPEERVSAATGIRSREQQVNPGDGDIFVRAGGSSNPSPACPGRKTPGAAP